MTRVTELSDFYAKSLKFLGFGLPKTSIFTSALLATVTIFYTFVLGSHLQLIVYYFLTRFTYIKPFDEYLVSRDLDGVIISALTLVWLVLSLDSKPRRIFVSSLFGILLAIAVAAHLDVLMTFVKLLSLPLIIFFLIYQRGKGKHRGKKIIKSFGLDLTLNYLVVIAIILGLYSILISFSVILASQDFPVKSIFASKRIPLDNYGYEIFILLSTLSPLLLIVIFLGSPIKSLCKAITYVIRNNNNRKWLPRYELELSNEKGNKKSQFVYISIFILFSMFLTIIPQLPTVNEDNQQIGSDSDSYERWITQLGQTETLQEFLKTAFVSLTGGDRPLSLIIIFLWDSFIDTAASDSVEYLPIILGPAIVLVVYFLTRELTLNETASLFAASLTGLGYFQVSMGIYAGFYANWIALAAGYSSLIFFFRYLRTFSKISLSVFFVLLLATLFSHAYTWTVFTIVMSLFLIVSFLLKLYPRKITILLLLVVLSTVFIDVVKGEVLKSFGTAGGVKLTISLAQSNIGPKSLVLVWETLVNATQHHFGGIFANFIVLGLVIYWLARSNLRNDFNIFIIVFLMIGIPPLFLGDWVVQSRVYYNIPFQIPAAIALTYLTRQKTTQKILPSIYVWLVAISLWTVSNFYKVSPT